MLSPKWTSAPLPRSRTGRKLKKNRPSSVPTTLFSIPKKRAAESEVPEESSPPPPSKVAKTEDGSSPKSSPVPTPAPSRAPSPALSSKGKIEPETAKEPRKETGVPLPRAITEGVTLFAPKVDRPPVCIRPSGPLAGGPTEFPIANWSHENLGWETLDKVDGCRMIPFWHFGDDIEEDGEPDIEGIKKMVRPHLHYCGFDEKDEVTITPFSKGFHSLLFKVSAEGRKDVLLRIPMPLVPWYRMQSEVATMEYVRLNTTVPIPRVYAFDSSRSNGMNLEWMLLEKIEGTSYAKKEPEMSYEARKALHLQVADWVDQISRLRFSHIGCLYRNWDPNSPEYLQFFLGPAVHGDFIYKRRLGYPVHRGPFNNVVDYYRSHIDLTLAEMLDEETRKEIKMDEKRLAGLKENPPPDFNIDDYDAFTEYDAEKLRLLPDYCLKLNSLLPHIHSHGALKELSTSLSHWDLSRRNIIVNDEGRAVALIDWEQVMTLPDMAVGPVPTFVAEDAMDSRYMKPKAENQEEGDDSTSEHPILERHAFYHRLWELNSPFLACDRSQIVPNIRLVQLKLRATRLKDECWYEPKLADIEFLQQWWVRDVFGPHPGKSRVEYEDVESKLNCRNFEANLKRQMDTLD
ncbi:hypothetical protein BDY21DRAFT_418047 [Lineolata rhizophorae]|uniref:Aminoglycoside phosphotransferase domain-containing protein n=1 Tax=Lineolata rhizophorae TaxID=578093 RepID=A0A6A6PDK5_9PEZI|nr:hypothetical protein BDY21DRAFT_418047 [Lineolata rhizophorae]